MEAKITLSFSLKSLSWTSERKVSGFVLWTSLNGSTCGLLKAFTWKLYGMVPSLDGSMLSMSSCVVERLFGLMNWVV